MKEFIFKITSFAFVLGSTLLLINYYGDAAHLFDKGYEIKMAEILQDNNYVTNISNYDERLFQKEFISTRTHQPDIVVLGSSRTMQITTEDFPDELLINNSVSGASVEDIIAIYQIYRKKGIKPKKIIIGIDPWSFNENNQRNRWQSIADYYYDFKKQKTSHEHKSLAKYKELFSFSYFQESAKNLVRKISGSNEPKASNRKLNRTNTKLFDGSLTYGEAYRNMSQKEVEKKAESYILGEIYGVENFERISNRIWSEFDDLINDMKENQIEIEFLLVPYHPLVYKKIKMDYNIILKVEEDLKEYANNNHVSLKGSFNPNLLKLNETYFFDGMHCKERGIKIILDSQY
ncbi:hypothetical protein [Maribacter cobaltidurans]|nr:hypothetical protein [Maribacter cobaltidurans]GGD76441.1 hypothetical protein GCM10011412_12700 [Maribacter cobaltidurans]